MSEFILSKADLPDPRPPRFQYHVYASRMALPSPVHEAVDLSYQAKEPYAKTHTGRISYESRLAKYKQDKSNVLARLSYDPLPRTVPGPKAVIYGRVSSFLRSLSDGEGNSVSKESCSLETQDSIGLEWYAHNRERLKLPPLERDREFADKDVSRTKQFCARPQGYLLLRYLMRGDHLIVPVFDRLGCNQQDITATLNYIFNRGVTVHICGFPMKETYDPDDPISQLMIAIMAAFSSMEVKNVSTRRKNATAAAKRSGKWNGNIVPFGFYRTKVDGEEVIKPSPFEQTVLRECYRCWLAGWSCYELKLALANRGIQRNGKFWDSLQLIDAIKQMHEEKKRLGLLEAIK